MLKRILTATLLLSFASFAMADEAEGITTNVGLNYYLFDSDRRLDNTPGPNLAIGYRFANPWAIEFAYLEANTENNRGVDVNSDHFRLDGLYHLETIYDITPFFSFGVGNADFETNTGRNGESLINAGIGAKYWFREKTALRPEFKLFRTSESSDIDAAFLVGLHHSFSDSRPAAAPEPEGPKDTDADGVMDDQDACPRTPSNASVDTRGCAIDTDGDGVADYKDACPGTDKKGARIDSRGCYEMLNETVSIELNVEFDYDSAAARPEHKTEVQRVFNFMSEYPQTKVTVEGHTDNKGAEAYNQNLSERRANTIAEILTGEFNISADRVSAVGHGEAKPIASNDTAEGRQRNRRVVGVVETNVEKIKTN